METWTRSVSLQRLPKDCLLAARENLITIQWRNQTTPWPGHQREADGHQVPPDVIA